MRIFATCDIGQGALDRLRAKGWELEVWPQREPPPHAVLVEKAGSGVDALITTLRDRIDEAVLSAGASAGLKVVAQMAVGHDNIDRAAASRLGIPFTNTPDVLTEATAEFAFFMMGAVARRTWPAEQMVRDQEWSTWHPWHPWLGDEVSGRTVAVIGLGRIGRSFVKKAVGFDMDVLCHDPGGRQTGFVQSVRRVMQVRHDEGLAPRLQTIEAVTLDDALRRADFVSLHVRLTRPEESDRPTLHLMDAQRLRLMKPTAYLVNTSRGPVVDEAALAQALLEGTIAGAALDVYETEPLPADSPLRDARLTPRLRLFPHSASAARQTRLSPDPDIGMAGRTVQAVIDVLEGRHGGDPAQMPFVVNKEAFRSASREG
jgi:glyoxylate reductase